MIIFGSNASLVKSEVIAEPCIHCNNANCVEMKVLQKYAHFFWIPCFPIGKTALSICRHCKQVLKKKDMPETYKMAYQNLLPQSKTPAWTFAGLVLVLLLGGYIFYMQKKQDALFKELIAAPQKGDIYRVKNAEGNYMLYKVSDIRGDTVFVLYSQTTVTKRKNTKMILSRGKDAFSPEQNPVLKSDLKKMLAEDIIVGADRN